MGVLALVATGMTVSIAPSEAASGGDYVPSVARAAHVFPGFAGGTRSISRGVSEVIPAGARCTDELPTTPGQRSGWTATYSPRQGAADPGLHPSVAIRRYASAAKAQAAFRVIKQAYQRCYGERLRSPGSPESVAFKRFSVPKIGPQTFGVTVWQSFMDDPFEPSMTSVESSLIWVSSGATIAVAGVGGGTAQSRSAATIDWAKVAYRVIRLR